MSWLPLPPGLDDRKPSVDPRVDPAALDNFAAEEAGSFGAAPDHLGAAMAPTRFASERARDAHEVERQQDRG